MTREFATQALADAAELRVRNQHATDSGRAYPQRPDVVGPGRAYRLRSATPWAGLPAVLQARLPKQARYAAPPEQDGSVWLLRVEDRYDAVAGGTPRAGAQAGLEARAARG